MARLLPKLRTRENRAKTRLLMLDATYQHAFSSELSSKRTPSVLLLIDAVVARDSLPQLCLHTYCRHKEQTYTYCT